MHGFFKRAAMLLAAMLLGFTAAAAGNAKVYGSYSVARPLVAPGGTDRDLANFGGNRGQLPSGNVRVTLTPARPEPVTFIVYDYANREVARARSEGGAPAVVTLPLDDFNGNDYQRSLVNTVWLVRIAPTGSAFDYPVGAKATAPRVVNAANTALLPPYRIDFTDAGGPAPPAAAVVAAAPARTSGAVFSAFPSKTAQPAPKPRFIPFKQPATPTVASSPPPSANPAPPTGQAPPAALARIWAPLLPLIDTHWQIGPQYVHINWEKPGEALLLAWDGLYGKHDMLLVPAADGKNWRVGHFSPSLGLTTERIVRIRPGRLPMQARNLKEYDCGIDRKLATLDCKVWTPNGERWAWTSTEQLVRSSAIARQTYLAAIPAQFPPLPDRIRNKALGAFAIMAGQRWSTVKGPGQTVPAGAYNEVLLEARQNGNQYEVITRSVSTVLMSGIGPLQGEVADPRTTNPDWRTPHTLTVGPSGETFHCHTDYGKQYCVEWRVSLDGEYALKTDYSSGQGVFSFLRRAPPPVVPKGIGVFAKLAGRNFQAGACCSMIQFDTGAGMASYMVTNGDGYPTASATLTAGASEVKNQTGKMIPILLDENWFELNGQRWTLAGNRLDVRYPDGKTAVWTETTPGLMELARQNDRARREYRVAVRNYNRMKQREAEEKRQNAQMWGNVIGQVAGILAGGGGQGNAFQPSTPQQWANRIGVSPSGAGQPAGYAATMGGSFQRYHAPASAEYLAKQAEIDRMEAYERMRKGVPASEPTRMQKIYNDYIAERAVTDGRRAEQRAADDAAFQRAQQARIAEDERSSNENVRKAAADARVLLEKQAQAKERADAAERQRVANAEALQRRRDEEDRAVKLAQEKQAQERLAQEKRAQQQAASTPAPKCYSKGGPNTLQFSNTYPYVEETRERMLRNSCRGPGTVTSSNMTCSERPGMKNWRNCVVTYYCAPVAIQCGPPRKAISQ